VMPMDRADRLSRNPKTIAVLAILGAVAFGGYAGYQTAEVPVDYGNYPEPVWDEDLNYTIDFGEHWVLFYITSLAEEPGNLSIYVAWELQFQGVIFPGENVRFVVTNATGDMVHVVWRADSVQLPDPVADRTIISITLYQEGFDYTVTTPEEVPF